MIGVLPAICFMRQADGLWQPEVMLAYYIAVRDNGVVLSDEPLLQSHDLTTVMIVQLVECLLSIGEKPLIAVII